jgi:hypothetical protein
MKNVLVLFLLVFGSGCGFGVGSEVVESSNDVVEVDESVDEDGVEEGDGGSEKTSGSEVCDSEDCFYSAFSDCAPATFSADAGFAAVSYEILGFKASGKCEVSMIYTSNPNPDWVDQMIICSIDSGANFQDAFGDAMTEVVNSPNSAHPSCVGPLVTVMRNL